MKQYQHRNYMEINLRTIAANAKKIKEFIGTTKLMSVVKTNAYGFGIEEVPQVIDAYSDWFAVATAEDALTMRRAGIEKPILVLGYVMDDYVEVMVKQRISLTTVSLEDVKRLNDLVPKGKKLDVHIKIDTGMNRIGLYSENHEIPSFVEQVEAIFLLEKISVSGIYTHFSAAGSKAIDDIAFTTHQYETFKAVCHALINLGYDLGLKHCCNSDAILNYPDYFMDMVRVGKFFFGFGQQAAIDTLGTRVPFSLAGRIIRLKNIEANETVSYDRVFVAKKRVKIATVSIGFGDGLRKNLYKDLSVSINGKRAKVVGKINMDFMMIDVTDRDDVAVGDYAIVMGYDGGNTIMPYEVAKIADASTPEIISIISSRVPRIYVD